MKKALQFMPYLKSISIVLLISLCLVCSGYATVKDVTLQWEHSIDLPYLQSYRVYYYTTSGDKNSLNPADYALSYTLLGGAIPINPLSDPKPITIDKSNTQITLPLDNIDNIKTYYFVVTAIDTRGLESDPTSEVYTKLLLTVSKTGIGGSGDGAVVSDNSWINCGADCTERYTRGTNLRLTATPNTTSTFMGWAGVTCPGIGDCLFSMDADKNVIASFALKGDIDGSGALTLADLILALKIIARISPLGTIYQASVGTDGKIGLDEAIYILQRIAVLR